MAKKRQKINWDNIPVTVIEGEGAPNLKNPYALLLPEERMAHLKHLCENIYLRMHEKPTPKNISESGDGKK